MVKCCVSIIFKLNNSKLTDWTKGTISSFPSCCSRRSVRIRDASFRVKWWLAGRTPTRLSTCGGHQIDMRMCIYIYHKTGIIYIYNYIHIYFNCLYTAQVGGGFNSFEKYISSSSWIISPQIGGNIKKHWKLWHVHISWMFNRFIFKSKWSQLPT